MVVLRYQFSDQLVRLEPEYVPDGWGDLYEESFEG